MEATNLDACLVTGGLRIRSIGLAHGEHHPSADQPVKNFFLKLIVDVVARYGNYVVSHNYRNHNNFNNEARKHLALCALTGLP